MGRTSRSRRPCARGEVLCAEPGRVRPIPDMCGARSDMAFPTATIGCAPRQLFQSRSKYLPRRMQMLSSELGNRYAMTRVYHVPRRRHRGGLAACGARAAAGAEQVLSLFYASLLLSLLYRI